MSLICLVWIVALMPGINGAQLPGSTQDVVKCNNSLPSLEGIGQEMALLQTKLRNNAANYNLIKEIALLQVKKQAKLQAKVEIIQDKLEAFEKSDLLKRAEIASLKTMLEAQEKFRTVNTTEIENLKAKVVALEKADHLKTSQIEALQTKNAVCEKAKEESKAMEDLRQQVAILQAKDHSKTTQINTLQSTIEAIKTVISCGDPGIPGNGSRTGGNFTFGQTVHYQCNTGYRMYGNNNTTCLTSGKWSARKPICEYIESITICEHEEAKEIKCNADNVIKIQKAVYDVLHPESCPGMPSVTPENCYTADTLDVVKGECDGKVQCTIPANNTFLGVDPCHGYRKSAKIDYICQLQTLKSLAICEEKTKQIICPAGQVIKIQSAMYGTLHPELCSVPSPTPANCYTADVLAIVKKECDGVVQCTVPATNTFLGVDPCPRFGKSAKINYTCELIAP